MFFCFFFNRLLFKENKSYFFIELANKFEERERGETLAQKHDKTINQQKQSQRQVVMRMILYVELKYFIVHLFQFIKCTDTM